MTFWKALLLLAAAASSSRGQVVEDCSVSILLSEDLQPECSSTCWDVGFWFDGVSYKAFPELGAEAAVEVEYVQGQMVGCKIISIAAAENMKIAMESCRQTDTTDGDYFDSTFIVIDSTYIPGTMPTDYYTETSESSNTTFVFETTPDFYTEVTETTIGSSDSTFIVIDSTYIPGTMPTDYYTETSESSNTTFAFETTPDYYTDVTETTIGSSDSTFIVVDSTYIPGTMPTDYYTETSDSYNATSFATETTPDYYTDITETSDFYDTTFGIDNSTDFGRPAGEEEPFVSFTTIPEPSTTVPITTTFVPTTTTLPSTTTPTTTTTTTVPPTTTTTTTTTTPPPTTTTTTTTTTPPPTTTTTTTTVPPKIYVCPSGFTKYQDTACYLFSSGTKSWTDARSDCNSRGANLLRIDSSSEQSYIQSKISSNTWIDINDRSKEGRFRYSDGSAPAYTNWARGEPNNSWWSEDCTHIKPSEGYKWNDEGCGDKMRYICETTTTVR